MQSKYLLIFIALLSLFLYGADIANAETGSITVQKESSLTYTPVASSHLRSVTNNFTTFLFDNSDYQSLVNYTITDNGGFLNINEESNFTSFTIISGGSGSGIASYSKSLHHLNWVFTPDTIITSSTFILSYAQPIFFNHVFANGTSCTVCVYATQDGVTTASVTNPVYASINGEPIELIGGAGAITNSLIGVSTIATNTYNVTYPIAGFYSISVSKSGQTISTKDIIHSNTQIQQTETTFNNNSFSFMGTQLDGIYLNVTLLNGAFKDVLINSSGCSTCINTQPTNNGGGGSPSGQVYYDYTSGTPGSVYGVNVSLAIDNFSATTNYYLDANAPIGNVFGHNGEVVGFPVQFNAQTYETGRLWTFATPGAYNVTLSQCPLFDACRIFGTKNTIDVATIQINPVQYNFTISTDKASYSVSYNISIKAINPSPNTVYVTVRGTAGIVGTVAAIAQDVAIAPSSTQYINTTIPANLPNGNYNAEMDTDFQALPNSSRVAITYFNITNPAPGTKESVAWNGNVFAVGNSGLLTYTTDLNASTLTVFAPNNTIRDTFVTSSASGSKSYVFDIPGEWRAQIIDNSNSANNSNATVNVIIGSDINKPKDYSLPTYVYWNQYVYHVGDPYAIDYKVDIAGLPFLIQTHDIVLLIIDPNGKIQANKTLCSITGCSIIAPMTGSISGSFTPDAVIGNWEVKIMYGDYEITNNLAKVVPSVGVTPPGQGPVSVNTGVALLNILGTIAFYGLVLYIGLLYGMMKIMSSSAGGMDTGAFLYGAVIIGNLVALIGLFAPFTMYVLVLTWIIAGLNFYIGRKTINGGT